jgi:hypothetical protein
LAIGGEEPVVVECRAQDPEATVEIQKVVFRVLTGAADKPNFRNVLASRPSGGSHTAKQKRKRQSNS